METRSKSQVRGSKPPPRALTVGGTQPVVTNVVTVGIQHVEPTSSATGHARCGKPPSRSSSLEAGPRRTFRQVPRSESTGGASGLAEGNPLRRQGQIGKGDDAGGGLVFFQDPKTASLAESGTFLHHTPDEGATFTLDNN